MKKLLLTIVLLTAAATANAWTYSGGSGAWTTSSGTGGAWATSSNVNGTLTQDGGSYGGGSFGFVPGTPYTSIYSGSNLPPGFVAPTTPTYDVYPTSPINQYNW